VRKIGLALPGVEQGTAYGSPALKVRGKLLACIPVNRSAEPGSLAIFVDFSNRAALLAVAPDGCILLAQSVQEVQELLQLQQGGSPIHVVLHFATEVQSRFWGGKQ
jgi:hypothetical protein